MTIPIANRLPRRVHLLVLIALLTALFLTACGGGGGGQGSSGGSSSDTQAPTVSITAPAGSSTASGTVSITATASDNVGVAGVQFFVDTVALGSPITASPYSVQWDTTSSANGTHSLTAKASDAAGNVGNSAAVSVTVSNQTATKLLLNANTLSVLRAKAAANDPTWTALKAKCDQYINGNVIYPDQGEYASNSPPNMGMGYGGEDFYNHVIEQGLCYQVLRQTNPSQAAQYGAKVVDILLHMSDPAHQQYSTTGVGVVFRDSGYAVRFFPTAMALGYDWAYDLLSSAQRTQIYNAINDWLSFWNRSVGWVHANVSGGVVNSIDVNVLTNYPFSSVPTVNIHGCGGSGATGTATLSGGATGYLYAIAVTNGGSGYNCTGDSTVTIDFNGSNASYPNVNWEAAHPLSNYFAGNYAAELFAAIGTGRENPQAAALLSHWTNVTHGSRVGPWAGTYLKGGGWPEGMQAYGPLATRHYNWPTIPVMDNQNINLVTSGSIPYSFGYDDVDYLMYFTKPSLDKWYVEDDVHTTNGQPIDRIGQYSDGQGLFQFAYYYGKYWNHPHIAEFHKFTKDVLAVLANGGSAWEQFMFWNAADTDADYTLLPLSHKLDGMQRVAARSDWGNTAVWWAFNASPYIDSPNQGEQFYGTGEFEIVRGNTPFIVLPVAWITQINSAAEQRMLANLYTSSPRKRSWFNIFFVPSSTLETGEWSASAAIPPLPLGESDNIGGTNETALAYEDTTRYVLANSTHLEDMYRTWASPNCGPITALARQLVYLRATNQLVVYDRSTICNSAYTQYLMFHTPANPTVVTQNPAVGGTTRLDVTYNSTFAGSIISVLPTNANVTSADLESPASNTVWRTTIAPPSATLTTNRWVTVFDVNTSAVAVWNASPLATSGNTMLGVLLKKPDGTTNAVVLSNAGEQGTTVAGTISYLIPSGVASTHVLTELPASSRYDISVSGGTVTVTPNGTTGAFSTTANGVLSFTVSSTGTVSP